MALMKASGLVCEKGGRLSHICTVAMEMGIPCVTKVKDATKFIKSGQTVSIDGNNSGEEGIVVVYE
jgi:pyruvate,water dikinase